MVENKIRWTTLLTLIGAVSFSLSALPGVFARTEVGGIDRSPAQRRECDLKGLKEIGTSAECELAASATGGVPGKVKARVNVKRTTVDKSADLIDKPSNKEEVEVFEISIEGEHSCDQCLVQGVRTGPSILRPEKKQFKTFEELNDFVMKEARRVMDEANRLAQQERKRRESEERCLTKDGREIRGIERMNCRIEKLDDMDEEKAAEYYNTHIKKDLQALLESNSPTNQKRAADLIEKLSRNSSALIQESVHDMNKFGNYKKSQDQLEQIIRSMPLNDPRRAQAMQQLNGLKQNWDRYFQARGFKVNASSDPLLTGLSSDINYYQSNLNQRFEEIASRHAVQINNGNANMQAPNANGRFLRGNPSSVYRGAPTGNAQGAYPRFNQSQISNNPSVKTPSLPRGVFPNANGMNFGKPLPGTPVQQRR